MNQVVIPKQIFIGDTAELRYSFHNNNPALNQLGKKNFRTYSEISLSGFCGFADTTSYSIKNVHLIQTGENYYTISITFIPWKIGNIQLPSYDITAALFEQVSTIEQVIVDFEPVEVLSIIEQKNLTAELNAPQNPKLLPGTVYGIYFRIISGIVALIIVIVLLINHKAVNFWIKNQKLKRKYRKNKNAALKNLEKALADYEQIGNEKEFCEILQKTVRHYLEIRFDYPFTNVTASELVVKYYEITLGLLSDEKNEAIEEIGSVFIRTDFIRYANNFKDEEKFTKAEGKQIIDKLKNAILTIETPALEKNENQKPEDKND